MLLALSAFPAMADENELVTLRRSILITGDFQRYIPFPFEVSSVNCGKLEVFQFKRSYQFFNQQASWELKYFGEKVSAGWYRFAVKDADLSKCAPVINITSSPIPKWAAESYSGSFMEIEPEDLGLMARGGLVPNNFFELSTDDIEFSYEMVAMAPGTERELASFINDTHFFSDTGKGIVGAIIPDSRGFLVKKVMFNLDSKPERKIRVPIFHKSGHNSKYHFKYEEITLTAETVISPEDNIIVREGHILVLIRKENL